MPGGADRAVTVYWANNPQTKTDLLYMADRNSSKETITVSQCLKFTFLGGKKKAKIWLEEIRCVVVTDRSLCKHILWVFFSLGI